MRIKIKKGCFVLLIVVSFYTLLTSLSGCGKNIYYSQKIRNENIETDFAYLYRDVDIPDCPLNLQDIVEIAFERNLEILVKKREIDFQDEVATGAIFRMIPKMIINGETNYRNKNTGSASQSLIPGIPPAPPSIASEQQDHRYDITLTWNLLDFGVSYFRKQQEVKKTFEKVTELDRLKQKVILDVSQSYWKAQGLKKAVNVSEGYVDRIKRLEEAVKMSLAEKIFSPFEGYRLLSTYTRVKQELQQNKKNYDEAIYELKQLMGLPPCLEIELVNESIENGDIPCIDMSCLEGIALTSRPELYGLDMEERLNEDEVSSQIIQLLPAFSMFTSDFYDSNRFLIFNHWILSGLRVSWDLLATPYKFSDYLGAKKNVEIARARRLQLSLAVVTQLRLAFLIYFDLKEEFRLAVEQRQLRQKVFETAEQQEIFGFLPKSEVFDYAYDALYAEINEAKAYTALKASLELVNNSLGIPFYLEMTGATSEEIIDTEDEN